MRTRDGEEEDEAGREGELGAAIAPTGLPPRIATPPRPEGERDIWGEGDLAEGMLLEG